MLTIDQLSFQWHGDTALHDVSFTVQQGQIVALLGPNGAGKTTLLRCILGQLKPSSGEVKVQGATTAAVQVSTPLISWVPQRVACFPLLSVRQNLVGFAQIMGVPRKEIAARVQEVLALIGLQDRADDLAKTLSGGMQRMLNVGIGLVSNPQILLIDEPTAGIDRKAQQRLYDVLETLKTQGLAILLTTHDLDDVSRLASRAVIMVHGQVRADGTVDELIHQRFTDQKEVRLELAGGKAARSAIEAQLSGLGLIPLGDDSWSGLISNRGREMEQLYDQISGHAELIRDFHLQKPGLDLLIHSLLDDARPRT